MKNIAIIIAVVGACVLFTGWLSAQNVGPTTQPANQDLAGAQQAMQRLMEQGPPITSPTVPGAKTGTGVGDTKSLPAGQSRLLVPPPSIVPTARTAVRQKLLPEGHYLADRRGRLVSIGDNWMFVFEADGKALADPPIKLMPNRWLEKMESDVAASHETVVFRVSGEVTAYRGQNFLLLRKVLIEREPSDNLK